MRCASQQNRSPMTGMGQSRQDGGKLQVQPCPQCPVSDGRPEKGGLSEWANSCCAHLRQTTCAVVTPYSITSLARPGARAMYLGNTEYRIHGTNQPSTIGSFVSSGCIRLTNEDVEDLYTRVAVGTRVIVLSGTNRVTSQLRPMHRPRPMRLPEEPGPPHGVSGNDVEGRSAPQLHRSDPPDLPL
jgi:hypothetical protein